MARVYDGPGSPAPGDVALAQPYLRGGCAPKTPSAAGSLALAQPPIWLIERLGRMNCTWLMA
jgi:hypothetical protein